MGPASATGERTAPAGPAPDHPAGIVQDLELTIFMPCYNEERHIVPALETAVAAAREIGRSYEIVVIDDASTDRSVELIRAYLAGHPELPIVLVCQPVNKGLAYNFVEGAFHGRGKYYRIVHGDNPEPKETMVDVLRHIGEADMILTYPIRVVNRTGLRKFFSKTYVRLVNFATGFKLRYWNGTSVLLRYDVMRWHSYATGFGFLADLHTSLLFEGRTFVEVGGVYQEQAGRKSKAFSWKNWLSVTYTLLSIFLRRVGRKIVKR
jgi:glycosyltransferase involved in cell wall biosynthesis